MSCGHGVTAVAAVMVIMTLAEQFCFALLERREAEKYMKSDSGTGMASSVLVRDIVDSVSGGQFQQLSGLFADDKNPLYFCMTLQQLLVHKDDVLHEHPGLLMRMFLSTVAECETQTAAEKCNISKQKITQLTFSAVAPLMLKQYGLRLEDTSKVFAKQLARYLDHMSHPINLDRAGPRITDKTANEHVSSMLRLGRFLSLFQESNSKHRFAGFLVHIRGANVDAVNIEHVLEKDLVLQYDNWMDCMRGVATNSRRKVVQHLCSVAVFALVHLPGLVTDYRDVPDIYRRLVNQLKQIEAQEVKSQADLIREKQWLPFPVLVELARSQSIVAKRAVTEKSPTCAQLAMDAALLWLLSRYSWRSVELTSLEIVSEEELGSLARKSNLARSQFLESCGRNFLVQPTGTGNGQWIVLTNTYKTVGKYQVLEDTLAADGGELIGTYISRFRKLLLNNQGHKFVFVGPTGRALTGSDIADMFERLTGVRLLCNVRRKATVTWALAQPNMDRDSLARLMRHSEKQQSQSYDKRINDVQTSSALISVEEFAERLNKKSKKRTRGTYTADTTIELGDVVQCGNTMFGKVIDQHCIVGGSMLTLLTLNPVDIGCAQLIPIFGDTELLQRHPIFQFVQKSAVVRMPNVEFDNIKDVYMIQHLKCAK